MDLPWLPPLIDSINDTFPFDLLRRCLNSSISSSSHGLLAPSHVSPGAEGSASPYSRLRIVIDVYVVGMLCVVGLAGNALTIGVLRRDRDKKANSTNWLLQALAVVDSLYLVACAFIQPLKTVHDSTDWLPQLVDHFPHVEPYVWPLASFAQTMTVWIVLLVTIDRYLAVCRPFSRHLRTRGQVQVAVAAVVLLAAVYNIPLFFEREIVYDLDECSGRVTVRATTTSLRYSQVYYVLYKTSCYLVFRAIGPLVLLLVLNILLVQALRNNRIRHQCHSSAAARSKHRENLTLMLVVVVSVFITCQLPDVVLRLAINQTVSIPRQAVERDFYRYVNAVTNVLLTLNSSVNFIIYCLVGKKFRRIFVKTFLGCCYRGDGGSRFGLGGGDACGEVRPLRAAAAAEAPAAAELNTYTAPILPSPSTACDLVTQV